MKKKVLKKAQKGTQVNKPAYNADSSRPGVVFLEPRAKPKPTPPPATKQTRKERKEEQKKIEQNFKNMPNLQGSWIPPKPNTNLPNPVKKIGGSIKSKKKK